MPNSLYIATNQPMNDSSADSNDYSNRQSLFLARPRTPQTSTPSATVLASLRPSSLPNPTSPSTNKKRVSFTNISPTKAPLIAPPQSHNQAQSTSPPQITNEQQAAKDWLDINDRFFKEHTNLSNELLNWESKLSEQKNPNVIWPEIHAVKQDIRELEKGYLAQFQLKTPTAHDMLGVEKTTKDMSLIKEFFEKKFSWAINKWINEVKNEQFDRKTIDQTYHYIEKLYDSFFEMHNSIYPVRSASIVIPQKIKLMILGA